MKFPGIEKSLYFALKKQKKMVKNRKTNRFKDGGGAGRVKSGRIFPGRCQISKKAPLEIAITGCVCSYSRLGRIPVWDGGTRSPRNFAVPSWTSEFG